MKSTNAIVAVMDLDRAETTLRQYNGHCGGPSMLFVEFTQPTQVNISQPIAIRHVKRATIKETTNALNSAPCHGVKAGVHQGDAPRLSETCMHIHAVILHMDRDIRGVEKIISKILLDHISLIPKAYNKVVVPER